MFTIGPAHRRVFLSRASALHSVHFHLTTLELQQHRQTRLTRRVEHILFNTRHITAAS